MNTATSPGPDSRPADLFIIGSMLQRRQAAPNLQAEAHAFCLLSKALADDPSTALRHLLEIARHLCGAGTAGLSLLRRNDAGEPMVRWETISGAMISHEGTEMPRDVSPCGLCLDTGTTIAMSRPGRAFAWLRQTQPRMSEDLIVPLFDNAKRPLGTLWLAHHDSESQFDADDARIAEQLAAQLVLTLKLLERDRESRHAVALLESHQRAEHELFMHDLDEQRRLRKHAEASEDKAWQALAFKDAIIQEAHHRVKNTLQIAASLLSSHARATGSTEVRLALLESYGRLQVLAKAHQLLYTIGDGTEQSVLVAPLLNSLADSLRESFTGTAANITLQVNADPLTLPVDEAIALALLANEAVMNAYKHAFPERSSGNITVNLSYSPEHVLVLQIADDGIGHHLDRHQGAGMGLKLIRTFATQLQGTLVFAPATPEAGSAVTLTIARVPMKSQSVGSPHRQQAVELLFDDGVALAGPRLEPRPIKH